MDGQAAGGADPRARSPRRSRRSAASGSRPCSSATTRRRRSTSGSSTRRRPRRAFDATDLRLPATTAEDELLAQARGAERVRRRRRAPRPAAAAGRTSTRRGSIRAVDPAKDVDGFHPLNAGELLPRPARARPGDAARGDGAARRVPRSSSTARAPSWSGAATIVGKPIAHLLLQANATVTICHSHTRDLAAAHARRRRARRRGRAAGARDAPTWSRRGAPSSTSASTARTPALVGDVDPGAAERGRVHDPGARRRRADDDRLPAPERRPLRPLSPRRTRVLRASSGGNVPPAPSVRRTSVVVSARSR